MITCPEIAVWFATVTRLPIRASCPTCTKAISSVRSPTDVVPPSNGERWMVTYSRNVVSAPITVLALVPGRKR